MSKPSLLIVGLVLLVWSADKLVFGSAALVSQHGHFTAGDQYDHFGHGFIGTRNDGSATAALGRQNRHRGGNIMGSNCQHRLNSQHHSP